MHGTHLPHVGLDTSVVGDRNGLSPVLVAFVQQREDVRAHRGRVEGGRDRCSCRWVRAVMRRRLRSRSDVRLRVDERQRLGRFRARARHGASERNGARGQLKHRVNDALLVRARRALLCERDVERSREGAPPERCLHRVRLLQQLDRVRRIEVVRVDARFGVLKHGDRAVAGGAGAAHRLDGRCWCARRAPLRNPLRAPARARDRCGEVRSGERLRLYLLACF